MKFFVDRTIFEKFPGTLIGVIVAKSVNNAGESEELLGLLRGEEKHILSTLNVEQLPVLPKVYCWQKAYSAFGAKPKEHRSSVENLHRLVLKGVELRHVNKIVDMYNYISLKRMLPVGGEDLDKMQGDLRLTFASASEPAVLLLGEKEARPPHVGEVIYRDDVGVVCRRWNWREADRTKLTEDTKNTILVIEALPPTTRSELETAVLELKELIEQHCGGEVAYKVLDATDSEILF